MLSFDIKKRVVTRQKLLRTAFANFTTRSKVYIHGHCQPGSEYLYPQPLFRAGYPIGGADEKKIHYTDLAQWIAESFPLRLRDPKVKTRFSRRPTIHFISCSAGRDKNDLNSFAERFTKELATSGIYCHVIAYDIAVITSMKATKCISHQNLPKENYTLSDFYPKGKEKKNIVRHGISAGKSNKSVFYCLSNTNEFYKEEYRVFFRNASNYDDNIIYDAALDLRLYMYDAAIGYINDNEKNKKKSLGLKRAKYFAYRMRKPDAKPLHELWSLLNRLGNYNENNKAKPVRCYEQSFMTYMAKGIYTCVHNYKSNNLVYKNNKHPDVTSIFNAVLKIWPEKFKYFKFNSNVSKLKDKILELYELK